MNVILSYSTYLLFTFALYLPNMLDISAAVTEMYIFQENEVYM